MHDVLKPPSSLSLTLVKAINYAAQLSGQLSRETNYANVLCLFSILGRRSAEKIARNLHHRFQS